MCVGAGGGLSVMLKAILNPNDEVITIAPHFVEYSHYYVQNHGGRLVVCDRDADFRLDFDPLAAVASWKTKTTH